MTRSKLILPKTHVLHECEVNVDGDGDVRIVSERDAGPEAVMYLTPERVKLLCQWFIEEDLI